MSRGRTCKRRSPRECLRYTALAILFLPVVLAQPAPTISAVLNGGAFDRRLSPGALAQIRGNTFGADTSIPVTIGGKPAKVTVALPTQLTVVIPADAAVGATTIRVGTSAPYNITLTQYAPGLLSRGGAGTGLVQAVHQQSGDAVDRFNPAAPGEALSLYATGIGPAPTLTIGGISANVQSAAAAPAQFGLFLVQFTVPANAPGGNQPIVLSIGGFDSQVLMLPVTGPKPLPAIASVVNGASFAPNAPLAAGSFASIFGTNFGAIDQLTGFPATDFSGVSVAVNGIKASLIHLIASAGQIDWLTPAELPDSGTVPVIVTTPNGSSASFSLTMASAAPGIFVIPSALNPARRTAAALFANTSWRVMPAALAQELKIAGSCRASGLAATALCGEPAGIGDFIQIYATGLGTSTPAVTIGGISASVSFAGLAPGFPGLYQVNVQVPAGAAAGDAVPLALIAPNGQSDTTATLAIRQ